MQISIIRTIILAGVIILFASFVSEQECVSATKNSFELLIGFDM
jgi:hypothetical protein